MLPKRFSVRIPSCPHRARRRLFIEVLESRVMPVIGAGALAFAADPRTLLNNGANLTGVVEFGMGNCTGNLLDLGGVVVGSRHILTAAHCLRSGEEQRLYVGGNGNFQLQFTRAGQTLTTGNLAVGAPDTVVQNALTGLANIGNGNVIVDGLFNDNANGDNDANTTQYYRIFFRRALNGIDVEQLQPVNVAPTATVNVATEANGFNETSVDVSFYLPRTANLTTAGNQDDLNIQRITFTVNQANIFLHPQWDGVYGFEDTNGNANLMPTPDLAILTLPAVAPLGASSYPLFTGANEVNLNYVLAGYGQIGTGTGNNPSFNQPQNELQRIRVAATGGSFTLSLNGDTRTVVWNANPATLAANLQAAIQGLPGITAATVREVTAGPDQGSFEVQITNPTATNLPQLIADTTNLMGTVTIRTIQNGGRNALHFAGNTFVSTAFNGTQLRSGTLPAGPAPGIGIVGSGDSGGPDFLSTGVGTLAIAGVHSYGGSEVGDDSTSVRVSAFANFLLAAASGMSPYPLVLDLTRQVAGNDGVADSIVIRRVGGNLEVRLGPAGLEQLVYRDTFTRLSSVQIVGSDDDDRLTIDFSGGDPIPVGGLTLDGGRGTNRILVTRDADFTLTNTQLQMQGSAAVALVSVQEAHLTGGASANTFHLGGWTGSAVVDGNGGSDTLRGPDTLNIWSVTQGNRGDINQRRIVFSNVENLTGGVNADTFAFLPGGSLAGALDGGAGTDRLDFSAVGGQTVTLLTSSANGFVGTGNPLLLGGTFAGIDIITGSLGGTPDRLVGVNAPAGWNVTAINTGQYYYGRTLLFSNFEFLIGGNQADAFTVNAGARITGWLDGGAGGQRDVLRARGNGGHDVMALLPGWLLINALDTLFTSIEEIRMLGQGGNDHFVFGFAQGNPVPVIGPDIEGAHVEGGTGSDRLTVLGSTGNDWIYLLPTQLAANGGRIGYLNLERMDLYGADGDDRFDARSISYQTALADVRFFGQAGNDIVYLAPSATTQFFIDGGVPVRPTFPGDALFFVAAGQVVQRPIQFANGGSDGLYRFLNRKAVQFVSIERGVGGFLDLQPWTTNFAVIV